MVIRIQTRDNEPVDKALRRLRKLCNNEGLTRVAKSKAYYEKPSERRRRESRERLKAIRLSSRAREQDAAKLLLRRRKARKAARARSDDGSDIDELALAGGLPPESADGGRRSDAARDGQAPALQASRD